MVQTDLKPNPTETQDDPLSHLHKMSTTAGLGSGDYVAVNGTAVFAVICGLASLLSLWHELFLIFPALTFIGGIVAWRQINLSNGTQTGKGLVIVACVLAVLFGGGVFVRQINETIQTRDDRKAVGALVLNFGEAIRKGDTEAAWQMTGEQFKSRVTRERFDTEMKTLADHPVVGKLKGTSWNELVELQTDPSTRTQFASTGLQFDFEKGTGFRENPVLKKVAGQWKIEAMNKIFPPPERGSPPPQ
jgi:hypothetical protein